jgi:hypothetical protein
VIRWVRQLPFLCAAPVILFTLAEGQTKLAPVNSNTPPARVAEIAWSALTSTCQRPDLPFKTVFIAGVSIEYSVGPSHRLLKTDHVVYEFKVSGPPVLEQSNVTEAAVLNGLRWKGYSKMQDTAFRAFVSRMRTTSPQDKTPASEWITPTFNKPRLEMSLKNGQWEVILNVGGEGAHGYEYPSFVTPNLFGPDFSPGVQYSGELAPTYLETITNLPCSKLTSVNPVSE